MHVLHERPPFRLQRFKHLLHSLSLSVTPLGQDSEVPTDTEVADAHVQEGFHLFEAAYFHPGGDAFSRAISIMSRCAFWTSSLPPPPGFPILME